MKKLTRLNRLVAGAAALVVLAACSNGPAPAQPGGSAGGKNGGVKLINPGKLTVCTHLPYAPFQYNDDSGKTVGFDVDLMDLVAKKLGVEQTIVDTPFEGIKSGQDLSTGKCDIAAAAMSITPEREKVILFSDPYFNATQALVVKSGSPVKDLKDLKGKKLGGQAATVGGDYAREHAKENGYKVVEYPDLAAQTQAVLTGQIDAAINDLPVWSDAIKKNPGKLTVAEQYDTHDKYGWGMKLGNTALKKVADQTLAESKKDGSYDKIYKKWIGTEPTK